MRVGVDASNLRAGGGVTHLAELLKAADPPAAGITGITVWGGSWTLDQLPRAPWLTRAHQPALDAALPRRQWWQRFELQALAASSCDLLFSPGGAYAGAFRPFVTMSRNLLPFQAEERRRYGASWMHLKLVLLRRAQAATLRRADGVIFLNEYAQRCVTGTTGPLRGLARVIPHGVDDVFRRPPRAPRRIDACSARDPFRLLYVSTVDAYKHQWHVVDAVSRLRREGVPVTLRLIGSGRPASLARLRAITARIDPAGDLVRYDGGVPHAQLPAAYHEADAFVFASSCENMPNILLEAMAAGLPIACARRGPMPDMLGDAGVYFDPEQPEDIASALRGLIGDPAQRLSLATEAHRRAAGFSWQRCASETLSFLRAVATRAGAA